MNAAITESFKNKRLIDAENSKERNIEHSTEEKRLSNDKRTENKSNKSPREKSGQESVSTESNEGKVVSKAPEQPIIITSTSISISLEENVIPVTTTTVKPVSDGAEVSSEISLSSAESTTTIKPKITKGK